MCRKLILILAVMLSAGYALALGQNYLVLYENGIATIHTEGQNAERTIGPRYLDSQKPVVDALFMADGVSSPTLYITFKGHSFFKVYPFDQNSEYLPLPTREDKKRSEVFAYDVRNNGPVLLEPVNKDISPEALSHQPMSDGYILTTRANTGETIIPDTKDFVFNSTQINRDMIKDGEPTTAALGKMFPSVAPQLAEYPSEAKWRLSGQTTRFTLYRSSPAKEKPVIVIINRLSGKVVSFKPDEDVHGNVFDNFIVFNIYRTSPEYVHEELGIYDFYFPDADRLVFCKLNRTDLSVIGASKDKVFFGTHKYPPYRSRNTTDNPNPGPVPIIENSVYALPVSPTEIGKLQKLWSANTDNGGDNLVPFRVYTVDKKTTTTAISPTSSTLSSPGIK
ncbi:TPA: hypothetical protein DDW35_08645 [Candidatus Sumerlaeota bacterium]|jgi:hypothetical protein|nr:hypothetical protein [Candidatus Sumerlaeota bacterium]